ncbi:MAG: hypothetical protein JNM43_07290 [Planctomycetaceae bacterium]|nr:hypothetical protein [Planctomycetaceae bacterium]
MANTSNSQIPSNCLEAYVLCSDRSAEVVAAFLNVIAPKRKSVHLDFPFPQFSDAPTRVFEGAEPLIVHLLEQADYEYSIYWDCFDNVLCGQVMLFFTADGGLIAGIANFSISPTDALSTVMQVARGEFGYVTCDSPPPESREEFIEVSRRAEGARIIDGRIECGHEAL